jgi:hypothetical protein
MADQKQEFAIVDGPTTLELMFSLFDCSAAGSRELCLYLRPLDNDLVGDAEPYYATIHCVYRDDPNTWKVFGSLLPHQGAEKPEATHVWYANYDTERRVGTLTAERYAS